MDTVPVLRLELAKLGVAPSWYKKRGRDGVKAYLSASELRELVGRLKVAVATRTKMRWGDAPPESPSDYAAMFWTGPPTKGRFPVASTLPVYFQSGLWSALTKASLKVELFTYSKELHGVPKHDSLTVVGAQELLEETTALSWLTCGAAIQHIADVIRLLAVDTRGGGGEPSRDDAEMERALEEKRGALLNHCDLAQFHAVVAAALRWWAHVLKCGHRDYAPMSVW